jgi:PKD repeat protein
MAIRAAVIAAAAAQSSECGFGGDPDASAEPLLFLNSAAFGGSGTCNTGDPPPPPPPPENQAPVAGFGSSCVDLTCSFTNTSSDLDGDALTFQWDFGDGSGSSAVSPTHTYDVGGNYIVTLVADDGTTTDSVTAGISVSEPATDPVMTAAVYPILVATNGRTASIAIDVFDSGGNGVPAATVTGTWTYEDRRGRAKTLNQAGVTDSGGGVTLTATFPKNSTIVSYCVSNVTKSGWDYVPAPLTCGFPLE